MLIIDHSSGKLTKLKELAKKLKSEHKFNKRLKSIKTFISGDINSLIIFDHFKPTAIQFIIVNKENTSPPWKPKQSGVLELLNNEWVVTL